MSISALLVIFILLAIASVFSVRALDGRIVRTRVIASRTKQLLHKADELKAVTFGISPLLSNNDISIILLDEQIDLLGHVAQLSNKAHVRDTIRALESLKEEFTEKTINQNRALMSDASIARHSVFLNDAAVVLLKWQKADKITLAEFNQYVEELSWAKLMISVVPLVTQSDQLRCKGDKTGANTFLKKALTKAENSGVEDDRKKTLIADFKEYLSGKRPVLSSHLIPELNS